MWAIFMMTKSTSSKIYYSHWNKKTFQEKDKLLL